MVKKSPADTLLKMEKNSKLGSEISQMVGLINLLEMEKLREKLDDYYKTIYGI